MKIPLHIAEKLLLLSHGERLPASSLKHASVTKILEDGALNKHIQGRSKSILYLHDISTWQAYLKNNFGIADLEAYIEVLKKEDALRAEAIMVSSESKLKSTRTFKGFLVNSYEPIDCMLNGLPTVISPQAGSFVFIYDYQTFIPAIDVTIVGIENPENFRHIANQRGLFEGLKVLFVSRYPQTGDLVKWLINIPNPYLHFGDFDFAGINIYLNEYQKHLSSRASFFVPPNTEALLKKYGNKNLYDNQLQLQPDIDWLREEGLKQVITLLHKYKKGLEQEVFIGERR